MFGQAREISIFMLLDTIEFNSVSILTLLHSEWPKLYRVLTILSAIGLKYRKRYYLALHVDIVSQMLKITYNLCVVGGNVISSK